jgi:hypothetical protein
MALQNFITKKIMFKNLNVKSFNYYLALVLLGVLLQFFVMSYGREELRYLKWPSLWFLGGIIAGLTTMVFSFNHVSVKDPYSKHNSVVLNVIFIGFALITLSYLIPIFLNNPPNPLQSDVIPTIQIMTQRLMHGQYPYHPVEFPGWSYIPSYLTMHYLPFIQAEMLSIDYRTWAYLIFVIVLVLFVQNLKKSENIIESLWNIMLIILPFIFVIKILEYDASIFQYSVELLDVAYYLFLVYSLFSKSIYLRAFAIGLCILSRYGIVLWIPAYALIYYWEEGRKKTMLLSGLVLGMIFLLYVLPFMVKDPLVFFKGINSYDQMAVGQWSDVPSWYAHVGKPYVLTQGLGFAIYFYEFLNGDLLGKIKTLKLIHILASLAVTVFTILVYHFKSEKIKDINIYLMGSFGLFLTVFYNFVFTPYSYLFLVPFFVLVSILYKIPIYRVK